jgi:hypothetical protein
VFQHDLGAVHVGFDRVHRLLDDQLDADGRGEMKDDVAAVDELGEQGSLLTESMKYSKPAVLSDGRCCRTSRSTGCPARGLRDRAQSAPRIDVNR